MGASLERSGRLRGATWDDFEDVVALLVRQERAATGVATVRDEFVRAEWELPSFQVGRDNWVAGATGYAALSPNGHVTLAAHDDDEADLLLAAAATRGRERGLSKLELRALHGDEIHARLVERQTFKLQTDVLEMWRALSAREEPPQWPPGTTVRTFTAADAAVVHTLLD